MSEYDEAVRLDPTSDPAFRLGAFHEEWMIGNAVNGGLVMAAALTGLGQLLASSPSEPVTHPDPVVVSAFFLTASVPGPFTTESSILRTGRRLSTGQVSVFQTDGSGQVERMRALASFGDLDGVETARQSAPPELPPPDECLSSDEAPPDFLRHSRFLDRVDLRLDPASAGWAMGKPSMRGTMQGWLRMRDRREPDTTLLLLALDTFPPVAFDLGLYGWTPTLEFTGHVRRRPEPGWLRVQLTSENLGGGMMEEDATIWDSAGHLVAQSRQLCGVRPPHAARA